MAVTSTVNFHGVKAIRASSGRTMGAPLTLTLGGDARGPDSGIVIFTDDQSYTDALIAAINGVNDAREADKVIAELASEAEAA